MPDKREEFLHKLLLESAWDKVGIDPEVVDQFDSSWPHTKDIVENQPLTCPFCKTIVEHNLSEEEVIKVLSGMLETLFEDVEEEEEEEEVTPPEEKASGGEVTITVKTNG